MDAIIGRYRARVEETGLVLRHAVGINFDLTPEETLGLLEFIAVYRESLLELQALRAQSQASSQEAEEETCEQKILSMKL